ncbi:hypothetical protein Lmor_0610 [Legionella moravica]|uniref:Archease n=1 Tax=Legionella moravica TaxID=39962 RepID=A0A378JX15_9GAMM|nr:archease [Legionella moravica]KTD37418.1 hypothetical protein Lmor_0610 [Legionella moravica]STX63104.1 Archease [Legionella moravica]
MIANTRWEHFTHDADIGVRGIGPTLAASFEMGALALTEVITDSHLIKPDAIVHVRCQAPDDEILFTDWLNTIIYHMEIHNMLFSEFHVTIKNHLLEAIIKGETVDRERHHPAVEVKGATYTELKVFNQHGLWTAQCIVDV